MIQGVVHEVDQNTSKLQHRGSGAPYLASPDGPDRLVGNDYVIPDDHAACDAPQLRIQHLKHLEERQPDQLSAQQHSKVLYLCDMLLAMQLLWLAPGSLLSTEREWAPP